MGMGVIGPIERLVLGLLTIHSGITAEEISKELERPANQIYRIIARLQDKGLIGQNLQPIKRK